MSSLEMIASKMNQKELVHALAEVAKSAKKNFERKDRFASTEANSGLVSRAKDTTNVANSWKANQSFNRDIEHAKIILKYIW